MKKTFYQQHPVIFVAGCIVMIFIIMSMYLIIEGFDNQDISKEDVKYIMVGICVIIVMIYSFVSALFYRVECLNDRINIIGDRGSKLDKIQFDDVILYSEIVDVKILLTEKNSQKKTIDSLYNPPPRLFFEFILSNGKTKWLLITPFSKKQRKEMLDIINSKTGKNFSYDELEEKDQSIYNTKNKK